MSKMLLIKWEISKHLNILAAKIGKENRVIVILDASIINTSITIEFLSLIDIISPTKAKFERIMENKF